MVTWDDAYVVARSARASCGGPEAAAADHRVARASRLGPVGPSDAAGQGRLEHVWPPATGGSPRQKGLAVTLREKIERNPHAEQTGRGAANVKLWTCLARRMNEESTKEESVKVHWTFDEAAPIAEHLQKDLGIEPVPVHPRRLDRRRLRLPPPGQPAGQPRVRRQRSPGRGDPADPGPGLRGLPARQLPGHVPRRQELEPGDASRRSPTAR